MQRLLPYVHCLTGEPSFSSTTYWNLGIPGEHRLSFSVVSAIKLVSVALKVQGEITPHCSLLARAKAQTKETPGKPRQAQCVLDGWMAGVYQVNRYFHSNGCLEGKFKKKIEINEKPDMGVHVNISVLSNLRQEDCQLDVSLVYTARFCLQKKKKKS